MYFDSVKNGLQTFFRWGFYGFIAWFPFMFYEGYLFNGTSTRAINLLIFVEILCVILGIALLGKKRLLLVKSPVTIALGVLLLVIAISSIVGVNFETSFWSKATRTAGLLYFLHLALFYVFFWVAFTDRKRLRQFIAVFLVSSGLFSVLAFLGGEGAKVFFADRPMPGLTIGNSTFAGMYLYSAFLLSIYYLATQDVRRRRWWKYFVPAIFIINPYLINFDIWRGTVSVLKDPVAVIGSAQASSFTVFLSMGILLVWWLVAKSKRAVVRSSVLIGGMIIALVLLGLGAGSLLTPGSAIQRAYLKQSTATRPIIWEFSKDAIAQRPLLGWGVDNFEVPFLEYYDNRILELTNGGEPYLDRAHNIFIDQLIETGYIGLIALIGVFLTLFASLVYVILRSRDRHDQVLASILVVYFFGHLLELQTAFDTTVTYVPLIILSAITAMLFTNTYTSFTKQKQEIYIPSWVQKTVGGILIIFGVVAFIGASVPIARAQNANGAIRRARSSEKRLPLYQPLLSSPIDRASFLWRTSFDLQKGVSLDTDVLEDPKQRAGMMEEFQEVTKAYEEYVQEYPEDYRARVGLAQLYIYQRLFGIDRLNDAHAMLDIAIEQAPDMPQAYWMHSVAYLYQRKFDLARQWAKRAYELNPNIEESTRLINYIERSIPAFPVIDLYTFKQY